MAPLNNENKYPSTITRNETDASTSITHWVPLDDVLYEMGICNANRLQIRNTITTKIRPTFKLLNLRTL